MSITTQRIVLACITTLIGRSFADFVCSNDFYGVLEGVPHVLPEHSLLPQPADWTVLVPPVCRGQYISGMEARVCTFLPKPIIRISNWRTALVHLFSNRFMYTSVNVTVYCQPYAALTTLEPTIPPVIITTPTMTTTSTTEPGPTIVTSVLVEPNASDKMNSRSNERLRTHKSQLDETRRRSKPRNFYRQRHPFSRIYV